MREREANRYSPVAYYLAKTGATEHQECNDFHCLFCFLRLLMLFVRISFVVAHSLPKAVDVPLVRILPPLVYGCIVYYMIGFRSGGGLCLALCDGIRAVLFSYIATKMQRTLACSWSRSCSTALRQLACWFVCSRFDSIFLICKQNYFFFVFIFHGLSIYVCKMLVCDWRRRTNGCNRVCKKTD